VDYCFADPPYNIEKKYDRWNDSLEIKEYFEWCDAWLSELARVVRPGRAVTVINIPVWCVRHFRFLCRSMRFHSWIAWEGLSLPVRMIMPAHYGLLSFSKGPPSPLPGLTESLDRTDGEALAPLAQDFCLRTNCVRQRALRGMSDRAPLTDLWADVHRLKHNSRRVDHPCQLPPQLMRRLFALFTRRGETILDCFNGAGTSTLVAAQMRRRAIGIELSRQYHDLAVARHAALCNGADPFAKSSDTPRSKNSRVKRLPKQTYAVSKKSLQLEARRIAAEIGRLPTRDDLARLSSYPLEYYDRYFISWGEVCAAARTTGMSDLPDLPRPTQLQFSLGRAET
jgi:site-specific DNA-methyltransferase (adenine-specific)